MLIWPVTPAHEGVQAASSSSSVAAQSIGSPPSRKVVALSSCEAEYIAAATAACQGVWLARLRSDLVGKKIGAPELKVDNMSAIALSKNPVLHGRSKHIDTKFHFIRKCLDDGKIQVDFTSSQDQLADVLTKSLGRARFSELRDKIGVVKLK